MVDTGEAYVRVGYLVVALFVLVLLRTPLRRRNRPGSRWVVLTILALSVWLGGVGLYQFVDSFDGLRLLFSAVMFAITLCFAGWLLVAVEFSTGRRASRPILLGVGLLALVHLALLVTNFVWIHELLYRSTSTVGADGFLHRDNGPLFWVHVVVVYLLVGMATVLFVTEWATTSGVRRRQAGILAVAPSFGFVLSALWYTQTVQFPFDPTPIGATIGIVILSWALYREEFLELVPVGRQTAVEELPDAIVILDGDDTVVDWNAAATSLLSVDEPRVGMPATAFFERVPDEILEPFVHVTDIETEVSLDGEQRQFWVDISAVGDGTQGRAIVIRDITPLKRRERHLEQQNESLDEFAAIVSHDLQSPLMGVRASADLALRTGDETYLEEIHVETDRMETLIDDLLALARAGQQVAAIEPVSLDAVSTAAWERIRDSSATCVVETDRTVLADKMRLQQLLENLFRNAVEHGQTNPEATDARITVTVGAVPDGFYVADDGMGIPAAARANIFEQGYTTAAEGTGLGLHIVKQVAEAHDWRVDVMESEHGGARFEFTERSL